jgi:predicted cation transporter
MMIPIAAVSVALVCFIIYALERRSKSEKIDWMDAGKLSLFGGIITAGVVFATTTDVVVDAVKAAEIPAVQDMFIGRPQF